MILYGCYFMLTEILNRHSGCRDRLFTAFNRSDSWLRKAHRYQISSLRCAKQGCIVGW
jgi:hypothetical protein